MTVGVEHLESERLGVLRAEFEDVSDLDAASDFKLSAAAGAWIAVEHLGRLDGAVGSEVAAEGEIDNVAARLVCAGHPARADGDAWIDEETDTRGTFGAERPGPDVALHEAGIGGEVGLAERVDLGGSDLGFNATEVDLAVARHADGERLGGAVRMVEPYDDVLERVRGRPRPIISGELSRAVEMVDECVDGRCVRGVNNLGRRRCRRVGGRGRLGGDGLGVGGVVAG